MKKISDIIIESNIHKVISDKKRVTARVIILNDKQQVLMLYSELFNDYTFPGGGIEPNESVLEGLKREIVEETGIVLKDIDPYGYTVEIRYGIKGHDTVYEQTSYYYRANILSQGMTNFVEREIAQGLSAVFIDIDLAIKHNELVHQDEKHQVKGLKTVLLRENAVLKDLKEVLYRGN